MSDIMKPQMTPRTLEQQQAAGPQSLNRDFRRKELLRITRENQHILKRIQQAQPALNHIQWEAEHRSNQRYLANCSEYTPRAFISRRELTPRSELLPLQAEDMNEHVPLTARSGAPQEPLAAIGVAGEPGYEEGSVKFVLKEDRQIGVSNYLVEMCTDGRALSISAHKVGALSLELVVKEQLHR